MEEIRIELSIYFQNNPNYDIFKKMRIEERQKQMRWDVCQYGMEKAEDATFRV